MQFNDFMESLKLASQIHQGTGAPGAEVLLVANTFALKMAEVRAADVPQQKRETISFGKKSG